jgi:Helix-turn-helix domain
MIAALSKLLAQLPAGTLIPVEFVLKHLDSPETPDDAIGDLNCAQAAKELGVKPGTVRGFCFRKEIKGAYLFHNKSWRIPRRALLAYVQSERKTQ